MLAVLRYVASVTACIPIETIDAPQERNRRTPESYPAVREREFGLVLRIVLASAILLDDATESTARAGAAGIA